MPYRLTNLPDFIIMFTGCFLGTNASNFITQTVLTFLSWLVAYVFFYFLRKPIVKFIQRLYNKHKK